MWWNDIKEIKEWMRHLSDRLEMIEDNLHGVTGEVLENELCNFEDYIKNVDKLNAMVNEFKGCISMSRAALCDRKEIDEMRAVLKNILDACQKHFNYQKSLSDQHFKINAIYKALCEKEEKKTPKKKTPVKKKEKKEKAVPDSLSQ